MKNKKISRSTFIKRVKDTIKQYGMIHEGDKVIAAVSGGPDSLGLLKALMDIKDLGVELMVVNLDHGIRGAASRADSDFVKELSRELGVPYKHKKLCLNDGRNKKLSFEERAREARYKFFKSTAKKYGFNTVATGHTMDDQAETVLMRFISGTSLKGLAGIPPVREEAGIRFIRPLIRTEKKDILDFLRSARWKYREDRTNKDEKYRRNSVRLSVMPYLERFNPRIKRSLVNLGDSIREDIAYIEDAKKKINAQYAGVQRGPVKIKISELAVYPRALKKEVFKILFSRAGGNVKKLTYRHWMDVDYFVREGERGKSIDLPGNIRARKTGNEIIFARRRK